MGQLGYYTHYQDSSIRFLQLGVRFYDPEIGRFTQRDPVPSNGSGYHYAADNPVEYSDATGKLYCHWGWTWWGLIPPLPGYAYHCHPGDDPSRPKPPRRPSPCAKAYDPCSTDGTGDCTLCAIKSFETIRDKCLKQKKGNAKGDCVKKASDLSNVCNEYCDESPPDIKGMIRCFKLIEEALGLK